MGIDRLESGRLEIILVDDSETDLQILERAISRSTRRDIRSSTVRTYTDAAQALANLPAEGVAVIVCDYSMPGSTGLDWLPDFLRADVGPVIILTGQGDEEVATEAFRKGAADYLVKSGVLENRDLLPRTVCEAIRRYRLETHNADLARRLKIANAELQRKNTKLTELTETAHRFVDNVAHEFRTPLTVIREFASIISDGIGGPVTEKQQHYLQFVSDATRDLAQLVDDFLDSSKLKARSLRVDRRPHSVPALLDQLRPMLESRASSKSITIREQAAAGLPEVFVDAEKVGRTVINLVVNAIKFSPAESEVGLQAAVAGPDEIEISVHDQGRGMSEEEVADIFGRFKQVGDHQSADMKGFGLGLSIANEMVWLNLGEIRVTSRPGAGSTFAFTVPVCDPAVIVPRYLQWVERRYPDCMISALRVRPENPSAEVETVRAYLTSICYPMDLILVDPGGGSVLSIGITGEPERWSSKILSTPRSSEAGPLTVEPLGTWSAAQARSVVPSRIPIRAQESRGHA